MSDVATTKNPLPLFQLVTDGERELTLVSWVDLPEWGQREGKDHFTVLCRVDVSNQDGSQTHQSFYEGTVTVDQKPATRDPLKVKVSPVPGTHIPHMTFVDGDEPQPAPSQE